MKEQAGRGGVVAPALSQTNTLGLSVGHGVLLCFTSTIVAGVYSRYKGFPPSGTPAPRVIETKRCGNEFVQHLIQIKNMDV